MVIFLFQLAPVFLALMLEKIAFAKAQALRRHLEKLVALSIWAIMSSVTCVLAASLPPRRIRGRIRQLLATSDIDFEIIVAAVLTDVIALIDRHLRVYERIAAITQVGQRVGHRNPGF